MEGKGTTFVVELPLGDSHIADSQKVATPDIDSSCISELTMYGDKALTDVMDDENPANESEDTKSKILIVEDNEELRGLLVRLFSKVYSVCEAQDGEEGLEKTKEIQPDIVLSDIMMPKMSGIEMCRKIKSNFETSHIPVILLTAQTAEEYTMQGLKMGADDYVTKPFSPAELTARVDALFRRTGGDEELEADDEVVQPPFRLNTRNRTLEKNGQRVKLTQVEYGIVKLFMENPGKALSREEILDAVWGRDYFGELKIVDVNIRRLRIKIEDDATNPVYITTVWGYGYKWGG